MNKNLILAGMMGVGKSTLGKALSLQLKMKFIDTDVEIEKRESEAINSLFENKGEDYFRKLEEKITLKSLKNKKNVIALGGGGFINDNIRKEVLSNHISFWLDWDESILLQRIRNSKKRPLVFKSTDKEIKEIIKKRIKVYSKAQFKINCNKLTKTEIQKKIIKIYELN